jgi:hypothetical protein
MAVSQSAFRAQTTQFIMRDIGFLQLAPALEHVLGMNKRLPDKTVVAVSSK